AAASGAAAPGTRPPTSTRPTPPGPARPSTPPDKLPGQVTANRWPGRATTPEITVPFLPLSVPVWLADPWHAALALAVAILVWRPTAALIGSAPASPAARRHCLGMIRARHRWHWLCRCTGLAQPELAAKNRPAAESRALLLVLLSLTCRLLALLLS